MSLSVSAILDMLDEDARAQAEALLRDAPPPPYCRYGLEEVRSLFDSSASTGASGVPGHEVSNLTIDTPEGAIGARCYLPPGGAERPAVVYFHGGGFTLGTLDGVDELCRTINAETGYVVISVDYRRAPENAFPAAVNDCLWVYEWLLREATSLGVDHSRVALAGDSAGGNLALSVCTSLAEAGEPMPTCLVLAYPATTNTFTAASWNAYAHAPILCTADAKWMWAQYTGGTNADSDPRAVPMLATSIHALPPLMVISAEIDPIRSDYEQFAEYARSEGVKVDLRRYDGVLHGFFTEVTSIGKARLAVTDTTDFLREHLR